MTSNQPTKREARLDSTGEIVPYDYCVELGYVCVEPDTEYIGIGHIYAIDEVVQRGAESETLNFWRKTKVDHRQVLASRAEEYSCKQIMDVIKNAY